MFWAEAGSFVQRDESQILQYWTDSGSFKEFMNAYPKNKKIISIEDKYYFDVGFSNRYAAPFKIYNNWSQLAIFDPAKHLGVKLDDTIFGGECTLWSEMATKHNIWEKILVRIVLFADTFWGKEK